MSVRFSLTLALALLFSPAIPAEEEDDFDNLDALLESNFQSIDRSLEEQFRLMDEAMEDAYQRLREEVKETWGENDVQLPTKKAWVDYSDDMKTRRVMDFENGVLRLERVITTSDGTAKILADLANAAKASVTDTAADLEKKDKALGYAKETLREEGIKMPKPPLKSAEPVLKDVATAPSTERMNQVVTDAISNNQKKVVVQVPFKPNYNATLVSRYLSDIADHADKQGVTPSLLLAVIETESSFNPRATSPIPAYGLMQLVPSSGAMDAYEYVYGEAELLGPDYLYEPAKNVELGAAYLDLLQSRYLRYIENAESRQLCAIAAYNTGAGNVARSFTGETSVVGAAEIINRMTPAQVYNHLRRKLPYEETRNYVYKVTEAKKKYRAYDGVKQ